MSAYVQEYPVFHTKRPDRWHVYVTVEPYIAQRFVSLATVLSHSLESKLSVDGYDAKVSVFIEGIEEGAEPSVDVRPPVDLEECSSSGARFIQACVQEIEEVVESRMELLMVGAEGLVR